MTLGILLYISLSYYAHLEKKNNNYAYLENASDFFNTFCILSLFDTASPILMS